MTFTDVPMTFTDVQMAEPSFRVRVLGFDRAEVRAFVSNLLSDYAQVQRDLDRVQHEVITARNQAAEARLSSETTARDVERILAGAQRIAAEIEDHAKKERSRTLAEANAVAGEILGNARTQAAQITDAAERRSAELDAGISSVREHHVRLRAAFEAAADTAAVALSEIAALEQRTEAPVAETADA